MGMVSIRCGFARRLVAAVAAVVVLAVGLCACKVAGTPEQSESGKSDAAAGLHWDPHVVADALPGLLAWQYASDAHGALVKLTEGEDPQVLWEAPSGQSAVQLEAVAPDGSQMVAAVTEDPARPDRRQHVILRSNGRGEAVSLPEGFEDVQDAGFLGDDVLLLAYHATSDTFATKLGTVDTHGIWHELTLTGDMPEYSFIESFVTYPPSDVVGVVLKTRGGADNRDDEALVLAKRTGNDLSVFTTPYGEDSLPGCRALSDGQGVLFGRVWSDNTASDATAYMRAEWTGSQWVESTVAPTTFASIIDRGDVIAADATGGIWVRSAASSGHESESTLMYIPRGSATPEATGIDATNVEWFTWVDSGT